jgi:hypothetical protein
MSPLFLKKNNKASYDPFTIPEPVTISMAAKLYDKITNLPLN